MYLLVEARALTFCVVSGIQEGNSEKLGKRFRLADVVSAFISPKNPINILLKKFLKSVSRILA